MSILQLAILPFICGFAGYGVSILVCSVVECIREKDSSAGEKQAYMALAMIMAFVFFQCLLTF